MTDAQGEIDKTACRVLQTEAEALTTLAGHLPADFERSVQLLAGVEGRVIISGIGKSGHIGRKISATLASTGTPSPHGAAPSTRVLSAASRSASASASRTPSSPSR